MATASQGDQDSGTLGLFPLTEQQADEIQLRLTAQNLEFFAQFLTGPSDDPESTETFGRAQGAPPD